MKNPSTSGGQSRGQKERIVVQTQQFPLQDTPFAGLLPETLPKEIAPAAEEQISLPMDPGKIPTPRGHGEVILSREKAHRGGKTVIIVRGFSADIPDSAIAAWARQAKNQCACGGSVEGRAIILQGDIAPRVRDFFSSHGFRVRGVS